MGLDKSVPKKQPFLCRIGLHFPYNYMPKVGGYLGDSIACRRCGYGRGYDGWIIKPEDVQNSIKHQAEIEYGRILGFYPYSVDALMSMQGALRILAKQGKFSDEELEPFKAQVKSMEDMNKRMAELRQENKDET